MATTYFVNANATPVSPYSTSDTGATSFAMLINSRLVNNGDTVRVCSDMQEDSSWGVGITLTSNDSTKYKIGSFETETATLPICIDGLTFYNAPFFGPPPGRSVSVEIRNCVVESCLPSLCPPIISPIVIFENNLCIINYPWPLVSGWLSVMDNVAGYQYVSDYIRINNNVFVHDYTFVIPPSFEQAPSFFALILHSATERLASTVEIYNNIAYNISNDPYVSFFDPSAYATQSLPMTNLVFENNNIYNGKGFFGGAYPQDAGTLSDTNTTVNPKFNPDYSLQMSSPLYNTGYNGIQIGLGLSPILTQVTVGSVTDDIEKLDFDGTCEPLPGYISILEKIYRLVDNFDPWLMPENNIQYYAHNLGYPLKLSRDDLGLADYDAIDSDVLDVNKKKYYRFMAASLPDWYKIKTSRVAIKVLLYSFGLLGDCVYYYTKTYMDPLLNTTQAIDMSTDVKDLYNQLCILQNRIDALKTDVSKNTDWLLSNWNPNKIEEDISNIPDDYFPTPHFRIWFDVKSSIESGNYSKRLKLQQSVTKAIQTVKPINTVFEGIVGYFGASTTAYAVPYVRVRKELRLFNESRADYWIGFE